MATRGNTRMEELVIQQGLVAPYQTSKELRDLKVRFGELVGAESKPPRDVKIYGFGTTDETIQLRKRK
jgi:hypothetical protein